MKHMLALGATASALLASAATASAQVVIGEFRTRGPASGNDEFIELYNAGSATADISGWTVSGSSNTGGTFPRATIAAGTSLAPGCHYLLVNNGASGYSGGVAGDATYSTGIADDGGIGLLDSVMTVIDQVGMSAGSAYKEGTPLAPLTTNVDRSYERRPGAGDNSQDTHDNSADFTIAQPSNPQNASSSCDRAPTAVNDSATVNHDAGPTAIDVLANDTDPDGGPKSIDTVTQPAHGTVAKSASSAFVTYQPNAGYCNSPGGSPDTFAYTLAPGGSSATVSVAVNCPAPGGTTTAPLDTRITKARIKGHRATFRFTGSGGSGRLTFQCKLDRKAFKPCRSPKTYRKLKRGRHIFKVRAADASGVDRTPATKRFRVKR